MLYHIDTDMGVDDGLALFLADRLLGNIHAVSTVFGNVSVETATRNALIFRHLLGRTDTWPILRGAACATDGFTCDAKDVHGTDGLGGATGRLDPVLLAHIAASQTHVLKDASAPSGSKVTLIGLGPATNIPDLLAAYGRQAIERIVLMSGVYFDVGNITPFAEFNAYCDPFALRAIFGLGVPLTIVPLDITRKVMLPRDVMAAFGGRDTSPLATLIAGSHAQYMDFYRDREAIAGCFPHDAITILAALAPDVFYSTTLEIEVDCSDAKRGRTTPILAGRKGVDVLTGGRLKWVREAISDLLQSGSAGSLLF